MNSQEKTEEISLKTSNRGLILSERTHSYVCVFSSSSCMYGSNNDNVYSVNENNDICMYECVRVAVVAVEVVVVGRYVGSTLSH